MIETTSTAGEEAELAPAPTSSPRVTVVITTHNRPGLLRIAVASALQQTYQDLHLIVLDDGSSVDPAEALAEIHDPRLTIVRNVVNAGITLTMRRGFSLGESEYFMLFADDDVLHPEFVAKCVDALDAVPDAMAVTTRSVLIDAAGRPSGVPEGVDHPRPRQVVDGLGFARLYFRQSPVCRMYIAAMMFRTSLMREHALEYPNEGFARCSDDLLLAEMAAVATHVVVLPDRLYFRRFHATMNSAASPNVISELLLAAVVGARLLTAAPAEIRNLFVRFVVQSALQVTRDLPYPQASHGVRRIREALPDTGLTMRDVLSTWDWRRRVEFSSRLGLWAVRMSQSMRLRRSAKA